MNIQTLKKVKKEKRMTLQQIADLSGIPKRTVDQIFSGKTTNPRIDTVEAIERALGFSSAQLEWTEEDKALGVGNHPTYLSERERKWIELGSEVLRIKGEAYYEMLEQMIEAVLKIK